MATIAKISSKGQIVIPAAIRRKLGSPKAMIIEEDKGKVILVPALTFEEAFDQVIASCADDDGVGFSHPLQARRKVWCLTHDG